MNRVGILERNENKELFLNSVINVWSAVKTIRVKGNTPLCQPFHRRDAFIYILNVFILRRYLLCVRFIYEYLVSFQN